MALKLAMPLTGDKVLRLIRPPTVPTRAGILHLISSDVCRDRGRREGWGRSGPKEIVGSGAMASKLLANLSAESIAARALAEVPEPSSPRELAPPFAGERKTRNRVSPPISLTDSWNASVSRVNSPLSVILHVKCRMELLPITNNFQSLHCASSATLLAASGEGTTRNYLLQDPSGALTTCYVRTMPLGIARPQTTSNETRADAVPYHPKFRTLKRRASALYDI
jgi:hypothetical protein